MAKKTKEVQPTVDGTAPAPAAPPKGDNDRFTRVFADGKGAPALNADGTAKRIAPQLQAIANTLEAVGESGCTRKELVELLSKPGVLTTRQPVGRILSYYQKDLVNFGLATRVPA